MDIEEALASLVASLKAGSTFENIICNDAAVRRSGSNHVVVNVDLIYAWLASRCLQSANNMSSRKRRNLEEHMRQVAENIAAAYELSNTLGCAMSECVAATAASYHAKKREEDLQSEVAAMPEATIKLLTALPLLALLAGQLLGGNPLALLVTTAQGWVLLAVGSVCYGLGLVWVRSMLRMSRHAMDCAAVRSQYES